MRLGSDGFACNRARAAEVLTRTLGRELITSNARFGNIMFDIAICPVVVRTITARGPRQGGPQAGAEDWIGVCLL